MVANQSVCAAAPFLPAAPMRPRGRASLPAQAQTHRQTGAAGGHGSLRGALRAGPAAALYPALSSAQCSRRGGCGARALVGVDGAGFLSYLVSRHNQPLLVCPVPGSPSSSLPLRILTPLPAPLPSSGPRSGTQCDPDTERTEQRNPSQSTSTPSSLTSATRCLQRPPRRSPTANLLLQAQLHPPPRPRAHPHRCQDRAGCQSGLTCRTRAG